MHPKWRKRGGVNISGEELKSAFVKLESPSKLRKMMNPADMSTALSYQMAVQPMIKKAIAYSPIGALHGTLSTFVGMMAYMAGESKIPAVAAALSDIGEIMSELEIDDRINQLYEQLDSYEKVGDVGAFFKV